MVLISFRLNHFHGFSLSADTQHLLDQQMLLLLGQATAKICLLNPVEISCPQLGLTHLNNTLSFSDAVREIIANKDYVLGMQTNKVAEVIHDAYTAVRLLLNDVAVILTNFNISPKQIANIVLNQYQGILYVHAD